MSGRWPYPGDSALVRARRVAMAYRALAETTDPDAVAALDARIAAWGEHWAVPHALTYRDDDWLSTAEAANLASIGIAHLRQLRARGRLHGRPRTDGRPGYEYRAGDIYALLAVRRRQTPSVSPSIISTDTPMPKNRDVDQ